MVVEKREDETDSLCLITSYPKVNRIRIANENEKWSASKGKSHAMYAIISTIIIPLKITSLIKEVT